MLGAVLQATELNPRANSDISMQLDLVCKLLFLVTIANGSPVIAKKLLGTLLCYPLDAGTTLIDGRPIFGSSKTVRGIIVSLAATTVVAPIVGLRWTDGFLIGFMAMAGDLTSSFLKRRMGYPPSSRCLGLDQIPESLLPVVASSGRLELSIIDVIAVIVVFFVGEQLLSRLLYWLRIRDEPY